MCMSESMCVGICVNVCRGLWRPEADIMYLLQSFFKFVPAFLTWSQSLLIWLFFNKPALHGTLCPHLLSPGIISKLSCLPVCHAGEGDSNSSPHIYAENKSSTQPFETFLSVLTLTKILSIFAFSLYHVLTSRFCILWRIFQKILVGFLLIFERVHNACDDTLHESTMTFMAAMEFFPTISVFSLSCTTAWVPGDLWIARLYVETCFMQLFSTTLGCLLLPTWIRLKLNLLTQCCRVPVMQLINMWYLNNDAGQLVSKSDL